jgi:hypothetical protein
VRGGMAFYWTLYDEVKECSSLIVGILDSVPIAIFPSQAVSNRTNPTVPAPTVPAGHGTNVTVL